MGKESFIIYKSFYKPISRLSDKQLGRLFRAIFRYQLGEVVVVEEDIEMAFEFFKNQFDIDESKYQGIVERNRNNGRKGGAPKGNQNAKSGDIEDCNEYKEKQPKQSIRLKTTQNKPNVNENVYELDIKKTFTDIGEKEIDNVQKTSFDKFNDWIRLNTPNVLKLQRQITETQFFKLKEKYDFKQIIDILQRMDNYKDTPKKYTSVYLTFLSWSKKEYGT